MWLYGSGFPKSMSLDKAIEGKLTLGNANTQVFRKLNGELVDRGNYGYASVAERQGARPTDYNLLKEQRLGKLNPTTKLAKQWQGWGTALKPSFEPIIVARKPFKGSCVDNVIEYGVGGINIDECRVGNIGGVRKVNIKPNSGSKTTAFGCNGQLEKINGGRFPANTILTYDETDFEEVCGGFPNTKSQKRDSKYNKDTEYTNTYTPVKSDYRDDNTYNDSGSAARYFYCAKASKKDRDEGLDEFEQEKVNDGRNTPRGETLRKNTHPTVKPTELMQYLVRLVTPDGGTVLDPFMGSGSTGKAVMYENKERNKNYKFIGIEKDKEYCEIAKARISYAEKQIEEEQEENEIDQISLF
jgi:site-specific DNA-methyltransferase (adenine-specific)